LSCELTLLFSTFATVTAVSKKTPLHRGTLPIQRLL